MVRRLTRSKIAPARVPHRFTLRAELLESREVPSASTFTDTLFAAPLARLATLGEAVQNPPVLPSASTSVIRPLLHEPRGRYAIGTDGGGLTQVNVYDSQTNALLGILNPFGSRSTLGVSVATGDVTGDGIEDIVVASKRGSTPTVKVYDGRTLRELGSFNAYSATFNGGVSVAVADVNGDGRADIVTGSGVGSAAHVKVFSGATLFAPNNSVKSAPVAMQSYMAFDTGYRGGISVAAGDVNGDGKADVIVGAQAGAAPHVKVFNGNGGAELQSFYAFAPSYTGGVSVAAGDLNGDGKAEIVVGVNTGSSHVRVFTGATNLIADYSAFGTGYNGARVATQDIDGDGKKEVIAVTGPGSPPRMRVLHGLTGAVRRESPALPPHYTSGLSVG